MHALLAGAAFLSPIVVHPGTLAQPRSSCSLYQVSGLQAVLANLDEVYGFTLVGWRALAPGESGMWGLRGEGPVG